VKQVEVKVEGESARPLIALIASASGSVSNWSTEVCVRTGMGGHCIISYRYVCLFVVLFWSLFSFLFLSFVTSKPTLAAQPLSHAAVTLITSIYVDMSRCKCVFLCV